MKKLISFFGTLVFSVQAYAQDVEMADSMRSEGKIYVVVTIVLVILGGLIAYVMVMDRKVTRLEKKLNEHKKG